MSRYPYVSVCVKVEITCVSVTAGEIGFDGLDRGQEITIFVSKDERGEESKSVSVVGSFGLYY